MIKIEKVSVYGFEEAIRGMRNPMNSWDRSDSYQTAIEDPDTLETARYEYFVGENDKTLMTTLSKLGGPHAKFRRMIVVYLDITAPLYWWKQFDTYKVGTVSDSCSTMHTLHKRDLDITDFSTEWLTGTSQTAFQGVIDAINLCRRLYEQTQSKDDWYQMIQLLPSSYNQRATIDLNYQTLRHIYKQRRNHKLKEWQDFCDWCETGLPQVYLITMNGGTA